MSSGIDRLASQLQKTINEKDKKKKTGYYAQSEVLKVTDDTVWVKIPGGIDETPVARTIDAKPGDRVQVRVEGGRAWIAGNYTDPATGDSRVINLEKTVTEEFTVVKELIADKATIGQLRAAEAEIDDLTATKANISDLSAATARIGALEADHVSTTDLQAANAEITSLKTTKADISDLNAATARIGDLEADHVSTSDLSAATARIGDLEADHVTVNDFTAATGRIGALEADHVTVNDFTAATGRIGTLETDNTNIKGRLTAAEADIDNVEADTAKIHNLTANQISATVGYIGDLTAANISASDISADHATVGSLDSNYAHITNGTIDNAKIGYADVNDLNTHYAGIDLANVNNAWIENGVVKDAAISDAKIIGMSANKLTAGTIDASNITVTNLNASNITTGTINGQRIGAGSLSLDKLSEDVYTEAEVNTIVDGLNDRIDGAIETFTGTVVPTLNNSPANTWTTTKLKDQHIGDVYYVVNSSSEQNGYCYRFTKSGSTYSWQLIKDSDVTAALARLETAEGKIGNIEAFDQEISTFKTTTEGQISTLQTKTTNLETSLGDKVSTATFNELSQTVDGNTASITTLTNTVSTKADSSTVTTLSNTVNEVSQTATANSSKISSLTTTLGTNADGTTKTGDIVHRTSAVEQDLSGFKTTVSETYTTKTDFNTYKANTKGIVSKTDYYLLSDNDEEPTGTAYEYKTASGEIATFDDGADNIQMPSVKVSIEPIQDLNGYDKPWAGGAGKNLFNKNNYLHYNGYFNNGVIVSNSSHTIVYLECEPNTTYTVSRLRTVGNERFQVAYSDVVPSSGSAVYDRKAANNSGTVGELMSLTITTNSEAQYLVLWAWWDSSVNPEETLQIEVGSTATAYEPYENICPIDGRTEVEAILSGKNIFGGTLLRDGIQNAMAGAVDHADEQYIAFNAGASITQAVSKGIKFKENTQYTFIMTLYKTTGTGSNLIIYYTDGTYDIFPTLSSAGVKETVTFITDADKTIDRFTKRNSSGQTRLYYNESGVFKGALAINDFEPYKGDTYTTDLGQTVYGGTPDIVSGELVIDRAIVDLGDITWTYASTYQAFQGSLSRAKRHINTNLIYAINSIGLTQIGRMNASAPDHTICINSASHSEGKIYVKELVHDGDITAFKAAMSGVQLCYELGTPQTIQLTPQEVKSLIGENNVWADAGTVDVAYVASSESEWTTETLTPNKYSPYVWWKHNEQYSNDTEFTSTPVIFNSYSQDILQTVTENYVTKTTFEVKADEIAGDISTVETTTKQYTDGKITQEVTDRNAAITAKATEITTSVSETYQTISGMGDYSTTTQMNSAIQQQANSIALSVAQTEIGKVRIGGQNLIENSEHFGLDVEPYTNSTATVYSTTVLDGEKCYYASGSKYVQVDFPTLTIGESYIFSCDAARQSGGSTVHVFITIGTNSPVDVGTAIGGTWKRFEVPFTASEETTFAKVQVYTTSRTNGYIGHFRHFKLEHGNIATDWSPAPADLESYADSAVATAKAEIKVTTDGISTEVSGKADANNVYTKSEINQTVSGLNTTIASKANSSDVYTKTEIDQTVDGINTSVSAKADGAETTASLALKANKNTLTSEINASADTVKINADRVNIAGAAIFSQYATKTDAQGYANTAEQNAKNAIPTKVSDLSNDSGFQTSADVNGAIGTATSDMATKTYLSNNYTNTTDLNAALDDKADSDDIPTKVSDLTNDSGFQTASDVETAIEGAKGKWYAECDTAAATTEKIATITPATTAFVLEEGVEVYVKFSITNSGAVKSIKLNVNGTGAYNIKVIYNGTIDNINAASYLKANYVYRFYWDGTYWIADLPYNSTYNLGTNKYYNTILAKSAITKERIIVGDESGYAMAASGTTFNIAYPILWTTASIAVNKTNYADLYTSTYDRTLAEAAYPSFVGSPRKVVYLVGTLNGNTVTISSEIITCTEPTSADGKIYIPIGRLGNQTTGWNYFNFAPSTDPTIYAYINGAFQPVSWSVKSAVLEEQYIYKSAVSGTSSMSGTDTWVTEDDDVQNTWTIKRPTYDSDYPVLFVAKQSKYVGGALYCTTPLKDDTTTVIDGGHITTGTIDASQVTVTNINADNITSGQLSSNYIATSSIIISDLTNDSGYYTSADVDERIEDQTYDLVETVTEHGEKIQSNSDRLDALELANSDQDTTIASLNLAIVDVSERIDPYENSIIVTDTSVTVQSGDGSVRVEDNRVAFKGGGNTVAWTDTEALNSKKMVATELHMGSLEVNDDESVSYVGSIAIIARQNGHVSIKKVQ